MVIWSFEAKIARRSQETRSHALGRGVIWLSEYRVGNPLALLASDVIPGLLRNLNILDRTLLLGPDPPDQLNG